ncbi:MAG: cupin domain-containing protein [Bacteroidia bacterium]
MAYKGKVIDNAYTGEVLTFLETAADTSGEYLKIKWKIPATRAKTAEHVHANNDEWYEVISGTLTYSIDRKEATAVAGEKIFFPKGVKHQQNNMGHEDLTFIYTCSPALDMENLIETISYLSITGKVKNGNPSFLQSMFWLGNSKVKVYDAAMPITFQNMLSFFLAPVGRIFGYKTLLR